MDQGTCPQSLSARAWRFAHRMFAPTNAWSSENRARARTRRSAVQSSLRCRSSRRKESSDSRRPGRPTQGTLEHFRRLVCQRGIVRAHHAARWDGFTFPYRTEPECALLSREIFEGGEYWFACAPSDPTILDCGDHIGLSVAWFQAEAPRMRESSRLNRIPTFRPCRPIIANNRLEDHFAALQNAE